MNKKKRRIGAFLFYHSNAILFASGLVVIIFTTHLLSVLNYIVGAALLAYAAFVFIYTFCFYRKTNVFSVNLSSSVVTALAGFVILFTKEDAVFIIGVAWGMMGLGKGGRELKETVDKIYRQEPFWLNLLQASVTIMLAVLLLFDPLHHIEFHLNVLGLEIIFTSMKAYHSKSAAINRLPMENGEKKSVNEENAELVLSYDEEEKSESF